MDLMSGLPQTELTEGYTVVLEARDPTSGAIVTGVSISMVSIEALNLGAGGDAGDAGPFLLVAGPEAGGAPGGGASV